MTTRMRDWLVLALFILVSEAAGVLGSLFTGSTIDGWYTALTRPPLAPPNWIFGPVWITLYLLMGIAAFLVWRQRSRKETEIAIALFGIQLALNTVWSPLFFGMQNPGAALIDIVLLWITIVATIFAFARIFRPAAWLLAPYIVWVSFAVYLNWAFWVLN